MKVFITGGSGHIGSRVVNILVERKHHIIALARSDASEKKLLDAGVAEILRGTITDLDVLKKGAESADAVIHCAFNHDFNNFEQGIKNDCAAVTAMAESLIGTNKKIVISSGMVLQPKEDGSMKDETCASDPIISRGRGNTENVLKSYTDKGVNAAVVRLPPTVHGTNDHGFIAVVGNTGKALGFVPYIGEGTNSWCAVNVLDAAELYVKVIESEFSEEHFVIAHAIQEFSIPFKSIAENIGAKLNLEAKSAKLEQILPTVGFVAHAVAFDVPASSTATQKKFNWQPKNLTLFEDIKENYFN
ncbi:unnamed protein product [[Candida] boidinii]|uniref:Unnamed protein product n=1 Tax=Candida boidinii TaxID=5477 RepID=A0A9W6T1X0_CANBO|nr:hypothetical protein BVG19_g3547 [[Candida] boidinii]OWB48942.1 hypothetical protein B5S27_g480 [[Candida] boidinii]OWB67522.1 hypothetical protein B5S30_g2883 [[Candida] boidinii]GME69583.1 unnamed protein product [[Candida] boidinii]